MTNFSATKTFEPAGLSASAPRVPAAARLYRSRIDKRLFGVCGGIAKHFDVDPNLVRLAVAALALFGGTTIPLYILAAVILPEEPVDAEPANPADHTNYAGSLSATA